MKKKDVLNKWDARKSEELYGIESWGQGYFYTTENGELCITPNKERDKGVSIFDIIKGLIKNLVKRLEQN